MATMYELTGNFLELMAMASNPEIDPDALADTLEAIEGEIEVKAENTAIIIRELESEAEKIKAEETRLAERRKAYENNVSRLKNTLYECMKATGKEKFKTTLYSFGIQKNPPKLIVDDEGDIPSSFFIAQAPKLDTAGIKLAIRNGESIPGVHLEQTEGLRIK